MKPLAIFDLDGTLANIEHRLHFIQGPKKDWDGFFEACIDDKPIPQTIELARTLYDAGWSVQVWSGRSDQVRDKTEAWMLRYLPIAPTRMRQAGDYQPDVKLKESWLLSLSDADRQRLQFVVDDRKQVVDMWRRHGVICLHYTDGEF